MKATFESDTFEPGTFACGTWRGVGMAAAPLVYSRVWVAPRLRPTRVEVRPRLDPEIVSVAPRLRSTRLNIEEP